MVLLEMGRPSNQAVDSAMLLWSKLDRYRDVDYALNSLFHDKYPDNENLDAIIIKTSVLNDYYNTNIFDVYAVSRHIKELHIDKELREGNPITVEKIRHVVVGMDDDGNHKERDFYSFATKYCCHHNADAYPIFDSIVADVLMGFNKEIEYFSDFTKKDLRQYDSFLRVLNDFSKQFGIDRKPREVDRYLWLYGKEKNGSLQRQFPFLYEKSD